MSFRGARRFASTVIFAAWLAASWVPSVSGAAAGTGAYSAEALRAALLVNFIRFTEWPTPLIGDAAFVVGIAGDRPLEDELIKMSERLRVRNRRIHVVRVKAGRNLDDCHILYISPLTHSRDGSAPTVEELLPLVKDKPVLTISEGPTFLAQGGIINLYSSTEGKLRFEIAHENARAGGLVLSAQLLALARDFRKPASEAPPPEAR